MTLGENTAGSEHEPDQPTPSIRLRSHGGMSEAMRRAIGQASDAKVGFALKIPLHHKGHDSKEGKDAGLDAERRHVVAQARAAINEAHSKLVALREARFRGERGASHESDAAERSLESQIGDLERVAHGAMSANSVSELYVHRAAINTATNGAVQLASNNADHIALRTPSQTSFDQYTYMRMSKPELVAHFDHRLQHMAQERQQLAGRIDDFSRHLGVNPQPFQRLRNDYEAKAEQARKSGDQYHAGLYGAHAAGTSALQARSNYDAAKTPEEKEKSRQQVLDASAKESDGLSLAADRKLEEERRRRQVAGEPEQSNDEKNKSDDDTAGDYSREQERRFKALGTPEAYRQAEREKLEAWKRARSEGREKGLSGKALDNHVRAAVQDAADRSLGNGQEKPSLSDSILPGKTKPDASAKLSQKDEEDGPETPSTPNQSPPQKAAEAKESPDADKPAKVEKFAAADVKENGAPSSVPNLVNKSGHAIS